MKFRPQLATHTVQRKRITQAELVAAGVTATFENVLDPATWKNALDLQIGDEVECVGLGWTRYIRVLSVGPEGATVEHISGEQSTPMARSVFVSRERAEHQHMFGLYAHEGGTWTRLAPGQTSLRPLVADELAGIAARDGNTDITLVPFDIAKVKDLFANGDAPIAEADILLPEGTPDPDRWVWAVRDARRERVAERFHRRTLPAQINDWLWSLSGQPYGPREPAWRQLEATWRAGSDVLLVRPGWSARSLCPAAFPEQPAYPPEIPEIEAAAAAKRERDQQSRKRNLYRKRQEENAKVSEAFQHRAIEAQQQIAAKFE